MSSQKIYIHMEADGWPQQTSKIQVPKTWQEKTVKDVIGLFVGAYNKKNPENLLDLEGVHLVNSEGGKLYSNDVVSATLEDRADYHIKFGKHVKPVAVVVDASLLRCKNYGCNQYYKEEENHDDVCCHHVAPPIFHDTMKCWSCCKDRKAYDFETFQLIQGCQRGRHSNQPPKVAIADSPNAVKLGDGPLPTPPALKSISAFNAANPTAASAVTAAVKVATAERKSTRNEDGTARCQRKGCQKVFSVAENSTTACSYHKGQPIFHDAVKIWSCCPQVKCYDFDEFLKVPGCTVGCHDDGVIEFADASA